MREITIYGLSCSKEKEAEIVDALNASLRKINRTTSKATQKSLLDERKPFILDHYTWNLNRDCAVYFEVYCNEDKKGKLHYPKDSSLGLLLMFVIQDHGFRNGVPLKKTQHFVDRIIKAVGVPSTKLAEGDDRAEVEAEILAKKTRRTKR